MPAQSEVTKPSKPHSPRSTSVSSQGLAVAGTPFRALKAAITVIVPALDRRPERRQVDVAQLGRRDQGGVVVAPAFGARRTRRSA